MSTKWQINKEVLSSKIDDEAILMSIEAGSYFGLDTIGSRIWELLTEKSHSINELVITLLDEYDVDEKKCIEDVQHFLDEMSERKLIQKVND